MTYAHALWEDLYALILEETLEDLTLISLTNKINKERKLPSHKKFVSQDIERILLRNGFNFKKEKKEYYRIKFLKAVKEISTGKMTVSNIIRTMGYDTTNNTTRRLIKDLAAEEKIKTRYHADNYEGYKHRRWGDPNDKTKKKITYHKKGNPSTIRAYCSTLAEYRKYVFPDKPTS